MVAEITSTQIKYCRFFCIFFMCMVHVPPGIEFDKAPQYLVYLDNLFGDVLGRASVAALSFISGFLLSQSCEEKSWSKIIVKKFTNLIIPMAFWNLVIILLGVTIFIVTNVETSVLTGLKEMRVEQIIMSRIFSIDYGSATQSLNFLRDIFVCFVIAPVIIGLARKLSWVLILLLIAFDFYVSFQPIVMRGMILIFFGLGIVYGLKFKTFNLLNRFFIPVTIALFAIILLEIYIGKYQFTPSQSYAYELFKRLICGTFAISCAALLAKRYEGDLVSQFDKCIYFLFLAHNVFFLVCWGAWQALFSNTANFPYIFFYLSVTVIWFIVGSFCVNVIRVLPKASQVLIMGKKYYPKNRIRSAM